MAELGRLLEVQEHDTRIDQLSHRRRTLPERAELDEVARFTVGLEATRAELAARHGEAAAEQARLEADLAATDSRVGEVETRLYGAAGAASRDLTAMADEVASLKRRRSMLEDSVLEAMEVVEPLESELGAIDGQRTELDERAVLLRKTVAEAEHAIDAELAAETVRRSEVAAGLPVELMETYERLRTRLGGVGAAALVGSSCGGCHLTIPSSELEQIRHAPPDAVVTCEQCGRILVRLATASGGGTA